MTRNEYKKKYSAYRALRAVAGKTRNTEAKVAIETVAYEMLKDVWRCQIGYDTYSFQTIKWLPKRLFATPKLGGI